MVHHWHGSSYRTESLKESPAKIKLMIRLTDGENNMGEVSPERTAGLNLGVKRKLFVDKRAVLRFILHPVW